MLDRSGITDKRRKANDRTRRYRRRLRRGEIVAPTPVTNPIVGLLLDLHWLEAAQSEDRRAIGKAIFRMLADASSKMSDA
jgi:hypothetical protein